MDKNEKIKETVQKQFENGRKSGFEGHSHTEEAKAKIGKASIGRIFSDEALQKRKNNIDALNKDKKISPEIEDKIAEMYSNNISCKQIFLQLKIGYSAIDRVLRQRGLKK